MFTERGELPRTLCNAVWGEEGTLDIVEGRGHCVLSLDANIKFARYITESIEN